MPAACSLAKSSATWGKAKSCNLVSNGTLEWTSWGRIHFSIGLGKSLARCGMGAQNAKDIIFFFVTKGQEKHRGEASSAKVAMDDELGDPAHLLASVLPAAGNGVSREDTVDRDPRERAARPVWKALGP